MGITYYFNGHQVLKNYLQYACNGVHSALVRVNEELLERKVAALV
jgi:hypothetical protein